MQTRAGITPVILAGGQGKRLRPLTGDRSPKPFLRLFSKYSLFQETVLRVRGFENPVIVCHFKYLDFVKSHLDEINVTPKAIILEPDHKGTAAAIALAAFYLKNQGQNMLVLPSDHIMEGTSVFTDTINSCCDAAQDEIVMIGARPKRAETGYGYILYQKKKTGNVHPVMKFIEKPTLTMARKLVSHENCLWNTGIFMTRPKNYLAVLKEHMQDTFELSQRAFYSHDERDGLIIPDKQSFSRIVSLSVDYAIMEKTDSASVCALPIFWSDVGTWPRLVGAKVQTIFGKTDQLKNEING